MFLEMAYRSRSWHDFFMLLSANLLLIIFPILWMILYFYMKRHKVGLSNAIFGEYNPWSQGAPIRITDPMLFNFGLAYVGSKWVLKKRAQLFNWSDDYKRTRYKILLDGANIYRHIVTDGNYAKLRLDYPMFICSSHDLT